MRLPLALIALAALTACAPGVQVTKSQPETGIGFGPAPARGGRLPGASGGSLARDFMDLSFALESGQEIATFTRFEGPVTVAMTGKVPASAPRDLAALVGRLQTEAGIDISQTDGAAVITIEFATRSDLHRLAPQAACFVVPNVGSLAEYRRARGTDAVDWARITRRERAAIFIPADTSPQEIRDCLHEEMAQALGPLNDLYRLPDSVFNDDNFHSVLTGQDMAILRLTYGPDLASGMTRAEVAQRLGSAGSGAERGALPGWTQAIETALGRTGTLQARQEAAGRALDLALQAGWQDNRTAFSHFAVGRLAASSAPDLAAAAFDRAEAIYATLPGGAVQIAHIDMQRAAMALAAGQTADAARLADRAMPVVQAAGNAALLATLMLIKAEALERSGDLAGAAALRMDSAAWARYGFGPDSVVKARMRDIAALADRAAKG